MTESPHSVSPDLDDDEESHGRSAPPGPWSNKGRAFVYGADDDAEGEQEGSAGFYEIGKYSNGGGSGGANGGRGGQVEMVSLFCMCPWL